MQKYNNRLIVIVIVNPSVKYNYNENGVLTFIARNSRVKI